MNSFNLISVIPYVRGDQILHKTKSVVIIYHDVKINLHPAGLGLFPHWAVAPQPSPVSELRLLPVTEKLNTQQQNLFFFTAAHNH